MIHCDLQDELFSAADIRPGIERFINNQWMINYFMAGAACPFVTGVIDRTTSNVLRDEMPRESFKGFPRYKTRTEGTRLYIPVHHNPIIDALALRVDQQTMTAYMFPVQSRLFRQFPDNSEERFFADWANWSRRLGEYKIQVRFLRVTASGEATVKKFQGGKYAKRDKGSCRHTIFPRYEVIETPLVGDSHFWKYYLEAKAKQEAGSVSISSS
jgi:hypothetical protein